MGSLILLLAVASYQTMQVHDEIMDEIADMLLRADLRDHAMATRSMSLVRNFILPINSGLDDSELLTTL